MGKGDQKGDKAFTSGKMSSTRFAVLKDTEFVNKPLKEDIKWTPLKVIIATLIFIIPYGVLIYILSSISPLITSLMVGAPIVIFAIFYFIHLMTKDL
ncbi:MAG: hypothetical protein WBA13_02125 [Microcoleaceae cyanobacterium]